MNKGDPSGAWGSDLLASTRETENISCITGEIGCKRKWRGIDWLGNRNDPGNQGTKSKSDDPGADHIVEYHAPRQFWLHVWVRHASIFGVIAGKSQFKNPETIYRHMLFAFQHKGIHQANGRVAYSYRSSQTVGVLRDGTETNWFTVIAAHPKGKNIGVAITAFPGLPGQNGEED